MQTFLAHPEYELNAKLLDWRRLGKERSEARDIARLLYDRDFGSGERWNNSPWKHHPVFNYWDGDLSGLLTYNQYIINEWLLRGYKNNINLKEEFKSLVSLVDEQSFFPEEVYLSHRCKLLQKDYDYYSKIFAEYGIPYPENWKEWDYIWLSKE